jgi:hypothetical protein
VVCIYFNACSFFLLFLLHSTIILIEYKCTFYLVDVYFLPSTKYFFHSFDVNWINITIKRSLNYRHFTAVIISTRGEEIALLNDMFLGVSHLQMLAYRGSWWHFNETKSAWPSHLPALNGRCSMNKLAKRSKCQQLERKKDKRHRVVAANCLWPSDTRAELIFVDGGTLRWI